MKQCQCGRWTPGVNGDFCVTCFLGLGGQAPEAVLRHVQDEENRLIMSDLQGQADELMVDLMKKSGLEPGH